MIKKKYSKEKRKVIELDSSNDVLKFQNATINKEHLIVIYYEYSYIPF